MRGVVWNFVTFHPSLEPSVFKLENILVSLPIPSADPYSSVGERGFSEIAGIFERLTVPSLEIIVISER